MGQPQKPQVKNQVQFTNSGGDLTVPMVGGDPQKPHAKNQAPKARSRTSTLLDQIKSIGDQAAPIASSSTSSLLDQIEAMEDQDWMQMAREDPNKYEDLIEALQSLTQRSYNEDLKAPMEEHT